MHTLVVLPLVVPSMPMLYIPMAVHGVVHVRVDTITSVVRVDHRRAVDDPPGNRSCVHPYIDIHRLGRHRRGNERECNTESQRECERNLVGN